MIVARLAAVTEFSVVGSLRKRVVPYRPLYFPQRYEAVTEDPTDHVVQRHLNTRTGTKTNCFQTLGLCDDCTVAVSPGVSSDPRGPMFRLLSTFGFSTTRRQGPVNF